MLEQIKSAIVAICSRLVIISLQNPLRTRYGMAGYRMGKQVYANFPSRRNTTCYAIAHTRYKLVTNCVSTIEWTGSEKCRRWKIEVIRVSDGRVCVPVIGNT